MSINSTHHTEDTIAAIATPPGAGGIGIIRISGSLSGPILTRLFKPRNPVTTFSSHRMYYGWIIDPATKTPLDEVLAVFMKTPNTYTREDVVEIHCHGSYLILEQILQQVCNAGAQPAQAGEFTKRAFLNGRLDLTRAEAVLDLLSAKTDQALELACGQLQGQLYHQVMEVREALIAVRAVIEVAIDFPEDDVDILDADVLSKKMREEAETALDKLLAAADQGKIYREGISAVILGRPNVGKSSLLNTLLREDRALVTAVPGTTRDTIEEYINIKGMPVRVIDTAGIRDTPEAVEELGIQRARAKTAEADLVLFLVDVSEPIQEEDRRLYATIIEEASHAAVLVVLNKVDLVDGFDVHDYARDFPGRTQVVISAKKGDGIKELEEAIFTAVVGGEVVSDPGGMGCAPNVRHRVALSEALNGCRRARKGIEDGLPPDLIAVDLQAALDNLADIVGETTTEDVLDMIFEKFCIGK